MAKTKAEIAAYNRARYEARIGRSVRVTDRTHCRVCKVALTDENWPPSAQQTHQYICSPCVTAQRRDYQRARQRTDRRYFVEAQQRSIAKLRAETLAAYGGACVCCGETTDEFLTIDHIHGDGAEHRRQLRAAGKGAGSGQFIYRWLRDQGFPQDRFQLLCMNCNVTKHRLGVCPHQRRPRLVRITGRGAYAG